MSRSQNLRENWGFVAVHGGAGRHAVSLEKAHKQGLARACKAAASILQSGNADLLEAVAAALKVMEDDRLTNAGAGSNLNLEGQVECDASVMRGDGVFGAVGTVPGVRNPGLAACLLAQQTMQPLAAGRVRPMFLAGDGARRWALQQGLEAAATQQEASQMHITAKSERQHAQWMRLIEPTPSQEAAKRPSTGRSSGTQWVVSAVTQQGTWQAASRLEESP
ncbi:hypothetical protein WJX84_001344 [Apatococcus fuscideae]|uniref:Asparaginase n=1 Tax=Apatococcus fuscideae TaxID=2026836 RepID=A0AAW1RRK6_9CHLO